MIPLQAILSYPAQLGVVIPVVFIVLTVLATALGAVYGYKKGMRKVAWGGLVWLFAGSIFSLCATVIHSFSLFGGGKLARMVTILGLAIFFIGLALVAYGICNVYYRPELRKEKEDEDEEEDEGALFKEATFEYSEDVTAPQFNDYVASEEELNGEEGGLIATEEVETKAGKIAGGFIFGATLGLVAFVVTSLIMLFINATSLRFTGLGVMFDGGLGAGMLEIARACTFDFLTIGVIVAFACLGWKIGFIKSLRVMLICVGFTAAAVLSFGLPFTRVGKNGFLLASLIRRISAAFGKIGAARLAEVASRLLVGGMLFLFSSAVMVGVCVLLHFLVKKYKKPLQNRALDSVLACVCFGVVGVLAVGVIWCGVATFVYADVIGTGSVLSEKAALSNAMLEGLGAYLDRFWRKFIGAF